MKQSADSEGLIVAGGILVIIFSLAGSLATGMGPIDFFFISVGVGIMIAFIGGGLLIGGLAVYKILKDTSVDDGRTFWQRLKQDYNWDMLVQDFQTAIAHVRLMIEEKRGGASRDEYHSRDE